MHRTATVLSTLLATSAFGVPITYQGELADNGVLADGQYDMVFQLADQPVLGFVLDFQAINDVVVEDGLFTVELDFDASHFTGADRWIAVTVEGTMLNPRQKVNYTPYAVRAQTATIAEELEVPWVVVTDTDVVDATSSRGVPIRGYMSSTSLANPAVIGETDSLEANAYGVHGRVNGAGSQADVGTFSAGVRGENLGPGSLGIGVHGSHAGSGWGVYGSSIGGFGVFGSSTNSDAVRASSSFGTGVNASTSGGDQAVHGVHNGFGTEGNLATEDYGVEGYNTTNDGEGTAIYGEGGRVGVYGFARPNGFGADLTRIGVQGFAGGTSTGASEIYGVHGFAAAPIEGGGRSAYGVYGNAQIGNGTNEAYGIYGTSVGPAIGWAGYFAGNVHVQGTLSKTAGSFKIDHPQDPENKYLSHSFVESPEMMNIYAGTAFLDENGGAVIELPAYFEALNVDFRYQLTPVGAPMPGLYIASEVAGNTFEIAGGKGGAKVSWQVTGTRQDASALANPIIVEQDKDDRHKGLYLDPKAYGFGDEQGIHTRGR